MPVPDSHNRGWVPDKFDERDRTYYYRGDPNAKFTKANLFDDYKDWKIWNQNDTNSCVANAMAATICFVARKHNILIPDPSRLFLYYNARALEAMKRNGLDQWPSAVTDLEGSNIRYAAKAISKLGIASDAKFPWVQEGDNGIVLSINDRPPDAAYEDASTLRAVEYWRLDPDHSEDVEDLFTPAEKEAIGIITLARVKQCLVEGYPVVFGFKFYWEEFDSHLANHKKPLTGDEWCSFDRVPHPHEGPSEDKWGGHAVVAVAFEVDKTDSNKGRVLIKNSYGRDHYPYFWMPFDWISDFEATDDFWMIRKVEAAPKRSLPAPSPLHLTQPGWTLTEWSRELKPVPALNSVFAAASRGSDTAEVFWITPTGQVDSMTYYADKGWERTTIVPKEGSAALGAIAAVTRQPGKLEIFWIAPDGAVKGAFSHAKNGGWQQHELAPAKSASVKSGLTAVSRSPGHQEVWWVAPDGSVKGRWYQEGSDKGWQDDYTLSPAGSAHVESNLASVVSPDAKLVMVWWVTEDGRLGGKHMLDDGCSEWRATDSDSGLESGDVALHTRLAVVSPKPDVVIVYWVSRLGEVKSRLWFNGIGSNMPEVAPKWSARVDSGLTAVAVNNRIDVHWVGPDNSFRLATEDQSSSGNSSWKVVKAADSGSAWAGSPLGSFTRVTGQYSVIFQDSNGGIVLGDVLQ